jgi:D-alanyl-D-alanine carboxypeptidase
MPPVRPRPAVVSGVAKPASLDSNAQQPTAPVQHHAVLDGSTTTSLLTASTAPSRTATPSNMRWVVGAAPAANKDKDHAEPQKSAKAEPAGETLKPMDSSRPAAQHTGWMIQIGATDDIAKANDLLARAKSQSHHALNSAQPFTEKVQKGSETLYRARFAGLEEDSAESACKALKRSGFSCFATKN